MKYWRIIPNPAALVYPETCGTVSEDAYNIASHLSSDRTHDKRGIRRQARYIQAVLKQTSRELLESFSDPSFTPFGLSPCLTHGPDLTRHIHSSLDQALLWGNQWNKSKLCSEQRQIRSFARLFKALSLRPTFQPTSTPEQASRLLVKMQRRFLNKRSAIRTAMRNTQSPADLCNWCQHRIEYCSSVCLIPSVAYCLCWQDPLVRLWPCLDSASVRSRESLVAIRLAPVWAPVILSAKCVVAFVPCGRKPPNFFECEVRSHSFLFPRDSWLQFAGHSHVQVASVYGKGLSETLYKQVMWNIHESPWLMVPIPAALVCPKTCDTVAEDAYNIASHLSSDRTHDKRGIRRQARYIQAVLKQTFQRTARKFFPS